MKCTLLDITSEKRNLKENIVELLSIDWPLNLKKIHSSLKSSGVSVTSQAVYKALQELVDVKKIKKNNKDYRLNLNWIKEIKEFSTKVEHSYLKKNLIDKEIPSSINFACLWDLYQFILNSFTNNFFEIGEKSICCQSEWVWVSPIGTENEWGQLKSFLNNHQMYVLIRSNTPFDKILKGGWENVGMKYILGVETCTSKIISDVFIMGDYIIQIYYPPGFLEATEELYSGVKSIEDVKMHSIQDYFYTKYDEKIQASIQKNEQLADRLRKQTEKHFNTRGGKNARN